MESIYNFLEAVLPFSFIQFDFMKNALLATLLVTPLFGMLGTMAVNNKMAFFSDALGHSALTGIAIGVIIGSGNIVISMLAFGILFGLGIRKVKNNSKASSDTVISVFSSASMALGIVILSKSGGFAKYSPYLIGDILTISPKDVKLMAVILIVTYVIWYLIYNKLLLISINPSLSSSRGIKNAFIENIFVITVAVAVMLSIKQIGILTINSYSSGCISKEYMHQFKAVSFYFNINFNILWYRWTHCILLCRHCRRCYNGTYICCCLLYNLLQIKTINKSYL